MLSRPIFIVLLISTLFLARSEAQIPFSPKAYVCYKADAALTIDGKMEESSWLNAKWTDDFIDIEGATKPTPRFRTRAKMLWDEHYFYIAAELEEPDVWATLTERDAVIFHDNDFEIFIDPDGDTHEYYEFEMNALNTVWDLLLIKPYRDGGPAVNGWDIKGLKSAVKVQGTINTPGDKDKGWTVEVAFPWPALRECAHRETPPKAGDQWRVNFSRVEWKVDAKNGKYDKVVNPATGKPYPEDNWLWSPQGLINVHYPEMWGFVQFSDKIAGAGEDAYVFHAEENAKWVLRQIYYGEKKYFENNKRYIDDLKDLNVGSLNAAGYSSPVIQHTNDCYEATIESIDGKEKWHIRQDGRTWKD